MKKLYIFVAYLLCYASVQAQWSLTGNAISSGNFLGTTNGQSLVFEAEGIVSGEIDVSWDNTFWGLGSGGTLGSGSIQNSAFGYYALTHNVGGQGNTAIGYYSMAQNSSGNYNVGVGLESLYDNTTGIGNCAVGPLALYYNTTASENSAFGSNALQDNTTGQYNSGFGALTLYNNSTGSENTAMGYQALYSNTASFNTAIGYQSMMNNTTGYGNVATGYQSMLANTTGNNNVAIGNNALAQNTTGIENVAIGYSAAYGNQGGGNTAIGYSALAGTNTANGNTAVGDQAMTSNSSGSGNAALGYEAMYDNSTGSNNTALGYQALYYNSTGSGNTAIGDQAGPGSGANLSNTIAIGNMATPTASNEAIFGNTATTTIGGYANWTNFSDGRYKKNIQEDVPGLEFINLLRPVTYTLDVNGINSVLYPSGVDNRMQQAMTQKAQVVYSGFIAQEVSAAAQKVNYDFSGVVKPQGGKDFYGLRYDDFVPPLVKSVQQLSKENDTLSNAISSLQTEVTAIQAQINELKGNNTLTLTGDRPILKQNAPNPFITTTTIPYHIPEKSNIVQLSITDANGNVLKTVRIQSKGDGQEIIPAAGLAPGTYFYTLTIDGKIVGTKKMVLLAN
ncbi:T9SS type A sorting domain-containing protein [Dinghuibacter silviterrae]|uniref:Putative secreted protein (Por secretion system target) n=1 Tax=Dinghuibacter silviterrae TaxID=1539049 RepID=A0A4V3GKW2_9BACT|nr:tail fiber domain-containing protein [Dinghuibacter silviterrae]TDW97192.1 putative secreted protein (Por secretion system target) [Dinghuibacter silviterrae]